MATPITVEAMRKGIQQVFDKVYSTHLVHDYTRITMPRRGRYQVWQGTKMVADRIKHRREALAVMKLLKENEDGDVSNT